MNTIGVRAKLIEEVRKLGRKSAEAAEYLDLEVVEVASLPGFSRDSKRSAFAADEPSRLLVVLAGEEISIWTGIAYFVAIDHGLICDYATLADVAGMACQRSGVFFLQIA